MTQIAPSELPSYISTCIEQGFSQDEIAAALGVTPAYISQLCTKHGIAEVAKPQFADIDALYEDVELLALQQLKRTIVTVGDPMKLVRIAQTLNSTKRRSMAAHPSEQKATTVVQLNLPQAAAAQFVFNGSQEAIAWKQGETVTHLATASTQQLEQLALVQEKQNELDKQLCHDGM